MNAKSGFALLIRKDQNASLMIINYFDKQLKLLLLGNTVGSSKGSKT